MLRTDSPRAPRLPRSQRLLPPFLRKRPPCARRHPAADIQGLVVHEYKIMDAACFLLLRIEDPIRARSWLRETLPDITTGADKSSEELSQWKTSVNLAVTWRGLKVLGLPDEALETFPEEFRDGMATRADILGDLGENAPEAWEFGGPSGPAAQEELHLLLMVYGTTEAELSALLEAQRARLEAGGLRELHAQSAAQRRNADGQVIEHFGFRDGISQPQLQGFIDPKNAASDHGGPVKPGEFLLGYENEYAEIPHGPEVPAELDASEVLPAGQETGWKDLGNNGTYLVMRKLRQDVEAFEHFLEAHKSMAVGETDEKKKQWLAAKLIGRWPNGAPLRPGEDSPPPSSAEDRSGPDNSFGFAEKDLQGYGCPVASHIRRANPRDALPPTAELSRQVSRRHRLLRRGITYSDGADKGMIFLALNANIARQFEFLQQTWLNNGKFGGRYAERDLLGTQGAGAMTLPQQPVRRCVEGIGRFVTVRGGAYFFLPGLKALKFLTNLR
jgi:Dyp-type peroxidase family